jgi:lysophospholipase L1-like esterase
MRFLVLFCLLLMIVIPPADAQTASFEFEDGDRILFVGDGLFEVALDYGAIESMLATRWPDRHVTFRNIGWSGDTVYGEARDHFTNPPTPYQHLMTQIKTARPTVAFVGYGSGLAFADDAGFATFETGLEALLDTLLALPARVVLLAPPPHEPERSPVPDVSAYNANLRRATDLISAVATRRELVFVDLFAGLSEAALQPDRSITSNGIHLNDAGYQIAADFIATTLGLPRPVHTISIDISEQRLDAGFGEVTPLDLSPEAVRFEFQQPALPVGAEASQPATLAVQGLRRGRYALYIDNQKVASASADAWRAGVAFQNESEARQARRLQTSILAMNDLFFQQYRPQNETYLTGFRQYEQGQNARELDLLTPLIGELDNEIGRLRVPRRYTYRLVAE